MPKTRRGCEVVCLRIAPASRLNTFVLEVRELGLSIAADTSALELIAGATDELQE